MTEKQKERIIEIIEARIKKIENEGWSPNEWEKRFIEIVKVAIYSFRGKIQEEQIKEVFSPRICPDQYVGKIGEFEGKDFNQRKPVFGDNWSVINIPEEENIMVMVLESPHKEEFNEKGEPFGPAKGSAGINIRKYILKIFQKHINNNNLQYYHLILMNPIPFQCSLGVESSGSIRNAVFAKAWNDKRQEIGESFFRDRLGSLLKELKSEKKSVFIVNACTAMDGQKKNIQNAINDVVRYEVLQLHHPSYNWSAKLEIQQNLVEKYFKKYPR